MKNIIIVIGVLIIAGVGYWLASPLFIDVKVSEKLEDIADTYSQDSKPAEVLPEPVSKGSFSGLAGHSASGDASLVKIGDKYYLRFEDNFSVTNGPDLFVYFGKDGTYDSSAQVARLKGNLGGQNYEIPAGINPLEYTEVWVWCRAFSVPFGKAILE